ncbi:Nuclear import receptor, partial [Coemansia helicoidea]
AFCMPVGQELGALLQQPELGPGQKQQVALLLDRLGVFLRYVHIEGNEPAELLTARIINDSWPLVAVALQRLAADPLVSEGVAKFVRVLVEFYAGVLRPVAAQVVDAVVQAFQQTGLSAYLWLARRILAASASLAAEESDALQLVAAMVGRLSEAALALFRQTPFSDVPETCEDYFRLVERALETAPGYVISLPSFEFIFQAAVAALDVNHLHAQLAVIRAWIQLLGPTKRHIRMAHDKRAPLPQLAGPAASSAPPSPRRQQRRPAGPDAYPVQQVLDLCVKHGFDLTLKLMRGMMQQLDRETVAEAADVFASLAAIVSDGPAAVRAQFDSPPAPTMYEWAQAVL